MASLPKDYRKKFKYIYFIRAFFCWVDPLFWLGCRRSLNHSDLYAHPSEADTKRIITKFNKYWTVELKRKKQGRSPRLFYAWFKCVWWRVLLQGLIATLEVGGMITQSELLGSLTEYFVIDSPSTTDTRNAYLYALGMCLASISVVFLHVTTFHQAFLIGLTTRILMTSAIYQKILTLSQTTVSQLTVGHIVNLASNDIHDFDHAFLLYHFFWLGPIHVIVVSYLLYREVQWAAFMATGLLVLQVPLQFGVVYVFTKLRFKAARMTDRRVKVMNEIISGIRVIKMYAWEYAFRDVVATIRKFEIYVIFKYFMATSLSIIYKTISINLIMFLMFTVYATTTDETITPRKVFVSLSLVTFVRFTSIHFFILATQQLSNAKVAWTRIKKFLLLDELASSVGLESCIKGDDSSGGCIALDSLVSPTNDSIVSVENLCASWSNDNDKYTLQDISFTVKKDKPLLAVAGSVGSGKSTLLQCLLKELPAITGSVHVQGSVGYASQEAWVFSATMRDNILFGLSYDADRYNTVIEACALETDIELLPEGDLTLVGERGVTLSGGQKARINLARAVYRNADIYLLDDPLSAVDAAVSRHIFKRCIHGLLGNKCVILVTHQIQYLEECDTVLVLKEGRVEEYDDPKNILKGDMFEMMRINDEENDCYTLRKASIALPNTDKTKHTNNHKTLNECINESQVTEDDQSVPISLEFSHIKDTSENNDTSHEESPIAPPPEERAHGTVTMRTYINYFIAGGGYVFTPIVVIIFILTEVNTVISDWWISDWADCDTEGNLNRSTCLLSTNERIGIYGSLIGSLLVFGILRATFYYTLLLNAAKVVHNRMFSRILRAPILFFDTNPIGRVLNRFSKDIGFLDHNLLLISMEYLIVLTRFVAIMITASIANPYVLIAVVLLFIVSLSFRWYYLKTARDIKRLEALARSPIYSHISLTLQGLPTIRSYSMQHDAINHFYTYQNQHTQAAYLYIVTTRWFGMRIDLITVSFILIVAIASISLSSTLNAGLVGLALTYTISLNGAFQFCVRQSAEVESLMVSAERVMAYGRLDTESCLETDQSTVSLVKDWPTNGCIEIKNLSYQHSTDGPLVLKGITCDIKSGEKVGIVGRTGAGKSSLIGALFRLAEHCNGSILIDGIDISTLGLHDVRNKMSIIPQDPVLFGGSIRYNLDPFNQYDDNKIWTALQQVQLKVAVEELEGLLESPVSEGGSNFSVGQRQLFCLARALLQSNNILILDEATANVDMETDAIIQQVIREQFSECTVLTIAHRLDTVMDSDRIMILRSGELVEFDVPHVLMNDTSSYLSKLVEQTGPVNAERLKTIALNVYLEKN